MESKIFAKLNFDPGILVILSLILNSHDLKPIIKSL